MILNFPVIYIDGHRINAEAYLTGYSIEEDTYGIGPVIGEEFTFKIPKYREYTVDISFPTGTEIHIVAPEITIEYDTLYISGVIQTIFPTMPPKQKLTGWKSEYIKLHGDYKSYWQYETAENDARFETDDANFFRLGYEAGTHAKRI